MAVIERLDSKKKFPLTKYPNQISESGSLGRYIDVQRQLVLHACLCLTYKEKIKFFALL